MGLIKPKKLKKGDTIGIVAPSNWIDPALLEPSVEVLRNLGFNVVVHPQCALRDRSAAGTTTEKINAIHDYFSDPSIDAIFCSRGGNRAIHLLDGLDYELIKRNPKIFMGFSDITALLSAFYTKSNIPTFHGLSMRGFMPDQDKLSRDKTLDLIGGNWVAPLWLADHAMEVLRDGDVTGDLVGGNLAMLYALAATGDDYLPDMQNKILVIEDIGEEIRAIDRMLGAFRLRGIFDQISGLIVGQISDVKDTSSSNNPFMRSAREVIMEHTAQMRGPVILNAPIGHEHPNIPFPLGINARLTAPSNGKPQLQLLESPFSDA